MLIYGSNANFVFLLFLFLWFSFLFVLVFITNILITQFIIHVFFSFFFIEFTGVLIIMFFSVFLLRVEIWVIWAKSFLFLSIGCLRLNLLNQIISSLSFMRLFQSFKLKSYKILCKLNVLKIGISLLFIYCELHWFFESQRG
jgi:hypothetical protein